MAHAKLMRGATYPLLPLTVTDPTGAAVDLTGCTCRVLIGVPGVTPVIDVPMTILDAKAGRGAYDPQTGAPTRAGLFRIQVKATFPDGRTGIFPSDGSAAIEILEGLA